MFVDREKLEELMGKYYTAIYDLVRRKIARREDIEDIAFETFERIYLYDIDNEWAYLKKVANSLIADFYKKPKPSKPMACDPEELLRILIDRSSLPTQKKRQELQDYLRELAQKLPEPERTIIELLYFIDKPLRHKEIPGELDVSYPKYKQLYDSALTKLKKEIERYLN